MGGATHSALTLIKGLKERSCEVIVVSPDMDGQLKDILESNRIRWYVVKYGFFAYPSHEVNGIRRTFILLKTILRNIVAVNQLSRIIKKEQIEIVHTNVGPVMCGYFASVMTGVRHVWHIREYGDLDFDIRMFPSKDFFRKCLAQSFVVSITNDIIKYNRLQNNLNASVIYNGVRKKDDVTYEPSKEKYFLCASRISPEKGFEQIIRVYADFHLKYPEYRLIIIGMDQNGYTNQLKEIARKGKILDAIGFEGYRNNVSDYMKKAKALLVASHYEGFGRMTAEAAFAGCLVIGKKTAGTKEILDITGGYPFMTDDEMLDAMIEIADMKEEEYRPKALEAQKKALQFFSEEEYLKKVYQLYCKILSN